MALGAWRLDERSIGATGNTGDEGGDDRAINNHSTLGNLQQSIITTIWLSRLIPDPRLSNLFFKSKQQIDLPSSSLPETKASYPLSQTLAAR